MLYNQKADYNAYTFDTMGVLIPLSWRDNVLDYLNSHQVRKEIAEKTGVQNIDTVIGKGLVHIEKQERGDPDFDKNNPDHKNLRSLIMSTAVYGMKKGEIIIPLEGDVEETLETLSKAGAKIGIYSAGTLEFLELIMGDIGEKYIGQYHSSAINPKVKDKYKPESYKEIAQKSETAASDMCYITDDPKEAKAAVKAGVGKVYLINRQAESGEHEDGYYIINTLETVAEETVSKDNTAGEEESSAESSE